MQRIYFTWTSPWLQELNFKRWGNSKGTILYLYLLNTNYIFQLFHYSRWCNDFTLPGLLCVLRCHHGSMNSTSISGVRDAKGTKLYHYLLTPIICICNNDVTMAPWSQWGRWCQMYCIYYLSTNIIYCNYKQRFYFSWLHCVQRCYNNLISLLLYNYYNFTDLKYFRCNDIPIVSLHFH